MKRLNLLTMLLAVLFLLSIAGCGFRNNNRKDELEARIEQLEQQIAVLEAASDAYTVSTNAADIIDETSEVTAAASDNISSDTVESLTKAVDEVIAKVDAAMPSENVDEKRIQFFDLKDELDLVENRLDIYDDYIESQYKRGIISYEEYRSQERELENLEDKLDASEDKLEWTFGVDD